MECKNSVGIIFFGKIYKNPPKSPSSFHLVVRIEFLGLENYMENTNIKTTISPPSSISADKIARDIAYHKAQEISKNMFDLGLISLAEYNKITEINRQTFSPIFAEIMPKIT